MTLQLHVDCQAHKVTKCNIVSRQAAMKFQRWPENVRSLESRWSLRTPRGEMTNIESGQDLPEVSSSR
jgi:hypothetical protein